MTKTSPTINIYQTGQRIRQIMRKRGLTVKEVQEYLDLGTVQSVYHWFRGRNLPSLDNLYALSELFKVPVDDMICGNREYNPSYRLLFYYEKLHSLMA